MNAKPVGSLVQSLPLLWLRICRLLVEKSSHTAVPNTMLESHFCFNGIAVLFSTSDSRWADVVDFSCRLSHLWRGKAYDPESAETKTINNQAKAIAEVQSSGSLFTPNYTLAKAFLAGTKSFEELKDGYEVKKGTDEVLGVGKVVNIVIPTVFAAQEAAPEAPA
eukprot:TRINITY_DN4230_c0_g1_i3.p1 TRINITY_DN4230_c0_g1~~TRINITY_DN4230_c0_g1_i3.p1  ORF type:complete len:164 (-),score=2.32 TRINITY_DN4230_c0_g1_i3:100-591(-)